MIKNILKAIRVHQWVKNLLLFVPLILAHKLSDADFLFKTVLGFFSFSFCASAFYIINDLLDLEADRSHPTKKERPFASGALQVSHGLVLVVGLLFASFLMMIPISPKFSLSILTYCVLTLSYSIKIKKIPVLDIIVLASFYAIRMVAGGFAANIVVSPWLLAFSMFMFLSLASAKRYAEMLLMRESNGKDPKGRGYRLSDAEVISQLGVASGLVSILVLALYINGDEVRALYREPQLLWFVCPVVLYWVSRVWLLAHRGELNQDPIVFALSDRVSYLSGAICGFIVYLAIQ